MHHTQWFLNCGLAWLSMKKNIQDSKTMLKTVISTKTIHRLITQFNITWFSQISSGKLRWWKSSRAHYSRRRASSSSGARFLTNVSKKGIRPTISVKNTRELLALSFCFKCSCFANFSPNPLKRTAEAKSGTQAILSQHSLRQFICKCLGQNQYTLHIANNLNRQSKLDFTACPQQHCHGSFLLQSVWPRNYIILGANVSKIFFWQRTWQCDDRVMHSLKRLSRMDHIKQVASGPFKYSSLLNTYAMSAMSLFSTQNGTAFSCPTLSSGSALQPPCGDSSILPGEVCISSTSATRRSLVVHVLPIVVSYSSQVLVAVLALVTSSHQERGARNFPKLQWALELEPMSSGSCKAQRYCRCWHG